MSTERIYQKDVYCSSNEAVITEVIQKNGTDIFTCDASCFYPEGGGQPPDTGTAATEKGVCDNGTPSAHRRSSFSVQVELHFQQTMVRIPSRDAFHLGP